MTERPQLLSNTRSDRVAKVKRLAGRSARQRHRQFLVEGPQPVGEALTWAPQQIRDLYLTPHSAERYPTIVAGADAISGRLHLASEAVLAAMSSDAQGVLAVAHQPGPRDIAALGGSRLVAVLTRGTDPGNVGTVIRVADAAGAGGVVLGPGSVEPYNPKVVRATAGSLFHLPLITAAELPVALARLRGQGMQVLAAGAGGRDLDGLLDDVSAHELPAHADGGQQSISQRVSLAAPTAWLFGNEAHGFGPAELEQVDEVVGVPIHGHAESLNVATAAAVCLYASARAQRGAH